MRDGKYGRCKCIAKQSKLVPEWFPDGLSKPRCLGSQANGNPCLIPIFVNNDIGNLGQLWRMLSQTVSNKKHMVDAKEISEPVVVF
jgi:hypothetical protein